MEVDKRKIPAAERGVEEARLQSEAVCLVRDLVNEPASRMTPTRLLDEAKRIAELPGVTLEYLDRDQAAARGMEAFLGVARGSEEAPYFIHLSYRPRAQGLKKRLVLVGKGITFDSGGLSLKPSEHMEDMKIDMAGAAVVLGVFQLLPKLKVHLEVHGLIPATENMPSGKAQKPGDIVRTISGKTIEVLNTDAEGRLALADAFGYALELKPDAIVDLATLTGACMVALGEEVAGLFSTDRRLARKLLEAAAAAGERVWELPLAKEYEELVKSEVADYKNITKSRYGGAITAAIFLKQFTAEVPWAHLDIAGPAWQERGDNPVVPKGATGFGVRTMVEFLKRF
ncbi:MAG: leucyl aminopeptidase [Patescibacteria group bacterium]|nr:leucyl aminopeptidase [Patescibacteria group bacterium]